MEPVTDALQYVCSQGRCFWIDEAPLPVCQRCLGLYAGFGLTVVWLFVSGLWRRGLPPVGVLALHVGLLLVAMAGGLHWIDPGRRWRLACGLVTGHVAAVWILGGLTTMRRGKGGRCLLCEAGHRPKVGRGPFRQKGPVPFSAPWPRWATIQAVAAVPLLIALAAGFYRLDRLGWWFWTVVALAGIAAAFFTIVAAGVVLVIRLGKAAAAYCGSRNIVTGRWSSGFSRRSMRVFPPTTA
jgi:hypothetical protein